MIIVLAIWHLKNFNIAIFSNTVSVINCQTIHDGSTHLFYATFSDLEHILGVTSASDNCKSSKLYIFVFNLVQIWYIF